MLKWRFLVTFALIGWLFFHPAVCFFFVPVYCYQDLDDGGDDDDNDEKLQNTFKAYLLVRIEILCSMWMMELAASTPKGRGIFVVHHE